MQRVGRDLSCRFSYCYLMKNTQKGSAELLILALASALLIGGLMYAYINARQSRENEKLDEKIRVHLSWARTAALLYSLDNKESYVGVCNSDKFANHKKDLEDISNSVVCKDSPKAWAMSAQLINNSFQHLCSSNEEVIDLLDNVGVVVKRDSAIATTSCK